MKKSDKKTELNHIEPLSDSNENSPIIDNSDEFVLFPLDVQETKSDTTNPITRNLDGSQEDDFILFPLDIKNTGYNTNNPAPILNQKPNKPKKQFVTKPNPQPIVNPQPGPTTSTSVPKTKNHKTRNLFWLIVICLSIYIFKNKETDESYSHFYSKTIHKINNKFKKVKSIFINEEDFKEFKKEKKIIYSPYLEYIEDDSGQINEVKGDSIIIIEPTGKSLRAYYLPKEKPFKLKISTDKSEYSQERLATEKMELDIDQNSFENTNSYSGRINVFLLTTGFFAQEISVWKNDILFENSNNIEVKYMRNRYEDFKKNTILTKYIPKSLLNNESVKADFAIELEKNNKVIKTKRELRHLFFSNGGLIAYFNDGTKVGCERCDFIKSNIDRMFKKKPFEYYSNDEILNEIKENGKEGWALVDYKWNMKVPTDQNNETPLYPDDYSNIISEIITNYYKDLNNNNFDAEKYYAKNVDQYISIKNTNPTNINKSMGNNDYQDGVSIVDESSISFMDTNPNNYYSYWSFNVEFKCFRPSKGKYQKCNITIYIGFDENNHIVSYLEKNVRNLKFYN